jgi:2-polyprenyl-3-methyl-5-hydroxy-6-metoxy-1,4-benzoquinol methylase
MTEDWKIKEPSFISSSGKAARLVNKFASADLSEPTLLDVGSGLGLFIEALNPGFKIDSSDTENFLSDKARGRVNSFIKCDLNGMWPFEQNHYGFVTAWNVLEHLENPFHFAREAFRVLKNGGLLFISIPNVFSARDRLKFLLKGEITRYHDKNSHITIFSLDTLSKIFSQFSIIDNRYCGFDIPGLPIRFSKAVLKRHLKNTRLFGHTAFFIFKIKK